VSKIIVSGNTVDGDLAGGNIYNTYQITGPQTALREMALRFREECAEDERLAHFIEQLQHFVSRATLEPTRDLEAKLVAGGRADMVDEALELKEHFVKKLTRLQFSEQAQEIFAHILSKIHAYFSLYVKPQLLEGVSRSEIDGMIYSKLLTPIHDETGSSPLRLDLRDLQGMLYFLTGNCHIRWD
jgi:hypothetical protein